MSEEQAASVADIHAFAIKWLDKFKDPQTDKREFLGRQMADDCRALGFEMDSGKAFNEKYGSLNVNVKATTDEYRFDQIDDIMVLGSGIYSKWRYFNHWAWSSDEIMEEGNREWFINALSRLAVLTVDDNSNGSD